MGFTITIRQAVAFCQTSFQGEDPLFLHNGEFDKARVKRLCPEARKICMKALNMIENARLSDWYAGESPNKIPEERLKNITDLIKEQREEPGAPNTPWYMTPFVWIAKVVHRLILGFQNIFLGRVSSRKLWDKIRAYRSDKEELITRVETNISLLSALFEKKIEARNRLHEDVDSLLELRKKLRVIQVEIEHLNGKNFIREAGHTRHAADISYDRICEVIVKALLGLFPKDIEPKEGQTWLQDQISALYFAAQVEIENPKKVSGDSDLEVLLAQLIKQCNGKYEELGKAVWEARNSGLRDIGFDDSCEAEYGYEKIGMRIEGLKSEKQLLEKKYALLNEK